MTAIATAMNLLSRMMARRWFVVVVAFSWSIVVVEVVHGHDQVNNSSGSFYTTTSHDVRMNNDHPTLDVVEVTDKISPSSSYSISRELSLGTNNSINPYTSGCLYAKELVSHIRVCNSEDPLEASTSGICRSPEVDYMEIRIFSDNWESITFEAWIIQIILSELLDVPTTVEAGSYEGSLNFYHPDAPMEYGVPLSDNDALKFAYGIGDCRLAMKDSADSYEACAHFDPERWTGAY
jgi:hypothetical protein